MKTEKLASIIIIAVVFSLFITKSAQAATWHGTVGGANVTAIKDIYQGGGVWVADLFSIADDYIDVIGFTYWTLGQYCYDENGYVFWAQYSGDYSTFTDWYWQEAIIYYRTCEGTSQLRSLGNHDFAYGGQHLYPYVYAYANH